MLRRFALDARSLRESEKWTDCLSAAKQIVPMHRTLEKKKEKKKINNENNREVIKFNFGIDR